MNKTLVFLSFISISIPSSALVEEFMEDRFISLQNQIREFCTKDSDTKKQAHCFSFLLKPEVTTTLLQGEAFETATTYWESVYAEELQSSAEAQALANQERERAQINFNDCTRNANAMNGATAENNARKACFNVFKNEISFDQCTHNANAMNGATAENNARKACTQALKNRMTFEQCSSNANAMNGATAENIARKECFTIFKMRPQFTFNQCIDNANRMNGATAENNMRTLCAEAFN